MSTAAHPAAGTARRAPGWPVPRSCRRHGSCSSSADTPERPSRPSATPRMSRLPRCTGCSRPSSGSSGPCSTCRWPVTTSPSRCRTGPTSGRSRRTRIPGTSSRVSRASPPASWPGPSRFTGSWSARPVPIPARPLCWPSRRGTGGTARHRSRGPWHTRALCGRSCVSATPRTSSTRSCPLRSTGCSSVTGAGLPDGTNNGWRTCSSASCFLRRQRASPWTPEPGRPAGHGRSGARRPRPLKPLAGGQAHRTAK
jgi:hypothetical protein